MSNDLRSIYNLLGLAQRAGQVESGFDSVVRSVERGQAKLVVIAVDCSTRTEQKIINVCEQYDVSFLKLGYGGDIGHAIGKITRVVVAVLDDNFARGILGKLGSR